MGRIRHLLAPLRSRDFVLVWLGQGFSQVGDRCTEIALIWLLIGLTGSSILLGSVLAVSYIPTLLLLLFGGWLADRAGQRRLVLLCDGLRAVVIASFTAVVALQIVTLPMVFALSVIYGIVSAFFNPALSALYPVLVPSEQYDAANGLRQVVLQGATLGGPALAGYLIAQWSVAAALAFDALTFVIAFLTLFAARRKVFERPIPTASAESSTRSRWGEIFGGIRFLLGERGVLTLILFFSLTNGINDVEAVLVPRVVRDDLHLDATAFGLLASCMGIGTLSGALITGLFASRMRGRAQVICLAVFVFGAAIASMGLAQSSLELDAAYVVMGISFIVPEVIFGTLLQRIIPAASRGRVYSVLGLIAMAMNPVGLVGAGALGDTLGPRAGLLIGGGLISLLSALVILFPSVRSLNSRDVTPAPIPTVAESLPV